MARRPAAIKDRGCGLTHSVPLFSCKQQEKNRRPGTTYRLWLSRKLQDDNRKWARPAASGWARIAVDNRTKQDENRKWAQPALAQRQFARRLGAVAPTAVLFEHDRSRLHHPDAMTHVGASHSHLTISNSLLDRPAAHRGAGHAFTSPR